MSGIIQNIPAERNESQSSAESAQIDSVSTNSSKWYIDEGVEGPGDRPSWMPEKFPTVRHALDSYGELEKRNTILHQTAPEEYDWGAQKEIFDLENQHIKDFVAKAKDMRMSQDTFDKVVDSFATYQKSLMPNVDEEIKKLGENAQAKIDAVQKWSSNYLTDKSLKTLGEISNTADVVELIDEIRQLHSHISSKVPSGSTHTDTFRPLNVAEITQKMQDNYKRYNEDKSFRDEINRELKMALGEE